MVYVSGTKLGPYELLSPIGAGGMGEVWKARDTRLGRIVAIKKVKEQHSERFKQEARSIAALNHPNICQLFDIGSDYLVLEYVDGKPLSCPVPEREAVRLAIQIATALEEAHRNGIVHRDLKPSNIMVSDKGSVKLLDFGLAKLYEQDASISSSPTADYPATQAGAILGTVAYMSPEQAQGQPADARSDIFAFGLVLYEMLSGRRAFSNESPVATALALVKDEPLPFQASPSLEKIVRRCMAKQPSGRYQTMAEVKTALEQAFGEIESKSVAEPQPSIAVLPFIDMSPGKDNEWFGDGLAEEIINALTQIPGLKVIARTSAFAFKGKQEDITKIAEALRVRTILEGSVRKAGNRIRITAQLITATDGSHLWSERYDREMTDVFEIQDEISQAIAKKLQVKLTGAGPLVKRRTENVEAYNAYLKSRYHLNKFTPDGLAKCKEYLEQALSLDPNYALAWFGLADLYHRLGLFGFGYMPARAANEKSSQAVVKALEIDENLPEAHAMMAVLHADGFDWKGAEREFRRALKLDPESADVLFLYELYYLLPMGCLDEAAAAMRKLSELDPLSPSLQSSLGMVYNRMQLFDRAIQQHRNALELDPQHVTAHLGLGIAYIKTEKFDDGIRAIKTFARLAGPNSTTAHGLLAYAYGRAGRIGEVQRLLAELQDLAQNRYVQPLAFAMSYLGLGEIDRALDWLDKMADEHDGLLFQAIPLLHDSLRFHPRYHALLRKMNLEA